MTGGIPYTGGLAEIGSMASSHVVAVGHYGVGSPAFLFAPLGRAAHAADCIAENDTAVLGLCS